jgi:hypothetical protein
MEGISTLETAALQEIGIDGLIVKKKEEEE